MFLDVHIIWERMNSADGYSLVFFNKPYFFIFKLVILLSHILPPLSQYDLLYQILWEYKYCCQLSQISSAVNYL